jgi:hypothetical protein
MSLLTRHWKNQTLSVVSHNEYTTLFADFVKRELHVYRRSVAPFCFTHDPNLFSGIIVPVPSGMED